MGLRVSHGCWYGGYMGFEMFRKGICTAMGGSRDPHDDPSLDPKMWYWGEGYSATTHPGLLCFLNHSDCDGDILPGTAELLANELEALLPILDQMGEGGGHLAAQNGYGAVARNFIKGCREAAAAGERIEFS